MIPKNSACRCQRTGGDRPLDSSQARGDLEASISCMSSQRSPIKNHHCLLHTSLALLFSFLLVFEQKRRDHCCCSPLPGGVSTGQRLQLAQDSLELFHMITILHSTKPQDRLPLTILHFTKHLFPSWLAARSKQLGRNRQELQQHVPRGGHQSY